MFLKYDIVTLYFKFLWINMDDMYWYNLEQAGFNFVCLGVYVKEMYASPYDNIAVIP